MKRPAAKGWCPSVVRPMMSGDGLLVRIRPRLGRLSAKQVLVLCAAATRFGSGLIDLTSRANLQLRGVTPETFPHLVDRLAESGILGPDPELEARRNIVVTPMWRPGDASERIATELASRIGEFPALPPKFGFAVDAGAAPCLCDVSADIRIERGADRGFVLRADGLEFGAPAKADNVVSEAIDLAHWFVESGGRDKKRMAAHLRSVAPPPRYASRAPAPRRPALTPGMSDRGPVYGTAFGRASAASLARVLEMSGAEALRVTPWRSFILEGGERVEQEEFVSEARDPILLVDACPGAPYCSSSTVETHGLARALAGRLCGRLHVSGCAKGCARPKRAETTLVGNCGEFNLVRDGHAWDRPCREALKPHDILSLIGAK